MKTTMKSILSLCLIGLLPTTVFVGCSSDGDYQPSAETRATIDTPLEKALAQAMAQASSTNAPAYIVCNDAMQQYVPVSEKELNVYMALDVAMSRKKPTLLSFDADGTVRLDTMSVDSMSVSDKPLKARTWKPAGTVKNLWDAQQVYNNLKKKLPQGKTIYLRLDPINGGYRVYYSVGK